MSLPCCISGKFDRARRGAPLGAIGLLTCALGSAHSSRGRRRCLLLSRRRLYPILILVFIFPRGACFVSGGTRRRVAFFFVRCEAVLWGCAREPFWVAVAAGGGTSELRTRTKTPPRRFRRFSSLRGSGTARVRRSERPPAWFAADLDCGEVAALRRIEVACTRPLYPVSTQGAAGQSAGTPQ